MRERFGKEKDKRYKKKQNTGNTAHIRVHCNEGQNIITMHLFMSNFEGLFVFIGFLVITFYLIKIR